MKSHRNSLTRSRAVRPTVGALFVAVMLTGSARAADVPVSYTVEEKPLKSTVSGTMLAFDVYGDASCSTLLNSVSVTVENVTLLTRIKQLTPRNDAKLPNTVEMRTTLAGVASASPLYLKVTGGGIVPVGGACQAQAAGVAGPPGPQGPSGPVSCTLVNNEIVTNPGDNIQFNANCPGGTTVTGGSISTQVYVQNAQSFPRADLLGWTCQVANPGFTMGAGCWAICC